jgi:hypothetical protein
VPRAPQVRALSRRRARSRSATQRATRASDAPLRARDVALLAALFALLALAVYAPSFPGPFISDDVHYVATNPYVHDLTVRNVLAILDPHSAATAFVANYAPVHLLLHSVEWQLFGQAPTGYHVVNVLLHALGSALLAAVFVRAGLSRFASICAALLFLLHPANVEAVAWISQAKTTASFALSMGALLAHRRRPALGALLFGLALLAKPTAAVVLPVAGLLDWTRDGRVRWRWLVLWGVMFGSFLVAEFWTHQRSADEAPIDPDWAVRLRTSAAIAARYVWMATTSIGVTTFHEPPPVRSWLDPLWLAGAALAAAIATRSVVVLRRKSPEVAFWAWAVASFAPVAQIFPFLYPMADRYLYFILPGLMGGALFAARDVTARIAERTPTPPWLPRAATAAALAVGVAFTVHTVHRTSLWGSPERLFLDSAAHYPNGRIAQIAEARRAARAGDADAAIAALRRAWQLGYNRFEQLQVDGALAPLRRDPRYGALLYEMAGSWIPRIEARPDPSQLELRVLAQARFTRGERDAAIAALERALAVGGPIDDVIRDDLSKLRGTTR